MAYNSAYTGAQIDSAVGAVVQKEAAWDAKQDKALLRTVTLAAAGWGASAKTQTVPVDGVSADESSQFIVVDTDGVAVKATAVAENSITFTAVAVPSADVTVKISIMAATT